MEKQVKAGVGSKVVLTIRDRKGNVVFHETIREEDVEIISAHFEKILI